MRVILLGYMGSGKSTVGKKLAKTLHYEFIDLDEYIVKKEGTSINEIFKNKGEIYFRKLEHNTLKEILIQNTNFVLALGGGTPCYGNNNQLINELSFSIYLKASIQELYSRLVKEKDDRPLIKNIEDDDLKEFIAKHLFERSEYYEKAKQIVSTDKKKTVQVVEEIMLSMQ